MLNRLHPEYKLPPGTKLFFPFDEARNSRAWEKLDASSKKDSIAYTLLVGQIRDRVRFWALGCLLA
jgi:hypothetical protein